MCVRERERGLTPNHTGDLGAAAVDPLDGVPVVGPLGHGFLQLVGGSDHGDLLVDIKGDAARRLGEAQQGFPGFVVSPMADEPPGTLGGQNDAN